MANRIRGRLFLKETEATSRLPQYSVQHDGAGNGERNECRNYEAVFQVWNYTGKKWGSNYFTMRRGGLSYTRSSWLFLSA
jgi:hypothetical protein